MSQLSMPNTNSTNSGGTIGEQLWGVRSSSSRSGGSAATTPSSSNNNQLLLGSSNAANLTRNSTSFAANPLLTAQQQQQQQQFFRSNSWNVNGGNAAGSGHNALSMSQDSRFGGAGGVSVNGGHFLLVKNITPQIDQSTLRALCTQHANGQLTYFKYIPNMSCVIVRYNTKEESLNAHAKLNSIALGNTTISTQLLSENDLK